jgi:hypothetical protein
VDITRIDDRSRGPQTPRAPLHASRLEQLGTPGRHGLDGADHDSAECDSTGLSQADRYWADRDCTDYDIVCFVDGSTTTWISPRSADVSRLMSRISEYGDVIAAVRPAAFSWLEDFSLRDRR